MERIKAKERMRAFRAKHTVTERKVLKTLIMKKYLKHREWEK